MVVAQENCKWFLIIQNVVIGKVWLEFVRFLCSILSNKCVKQSMLRYYNNMNTFWKSCALQDYSSILVFCSLTQLYIAKSVCTLESGPQLCDMWLWLRSVRWGQDNLQGKKKIHIIILGLKFFCYYSWCAHIFVGSHCSKQKNLKNRLSQLLSYQFRALLLAVNALRHKTANVVTIAEMTNS